MIGDDEETRVIRKLKSGEYRLYSRKKDPKTGKRKKPRDLQRDGESKTTRERRALFQAGVIVPGLRSLGVVGTMTPA